MFKLFSHSSYFKAFFFLLMYPVIESIEGDTFTFTDSDLKRKFAPAYCMIKRLDKLAKEGLLSYAKNEDDSYTVTIPDYEHVRQAMKTIVKFLFLKDIAVNCEE